MSRHSSQSNEYFNIIEKCIQIPKDDRLFLRANVHNPDLIAIFTSWKKRNDQRKLYMDLRKFLAQNKRTKMKNVSPRKNSTRQTSTRQNSTRQTNPRSLSKQLLCIHTAEKTESESCKHQTIANRSGKEFKFHTSSFREHEAPSHKKKWTEDEIVKKYADLFTAPDFLKKHRAISQDTDPDSLNFMVSCQSFVCQPKYYALQGFSAEQIFSYVFCEPSLLRISRNFFCFKMEALYQDLRVETPDLHEMFLFIDKANDGFIDVNEMGQFLEYACSTREERKLFNKLDTNRLGYFTEQQMIQITRDRQLTRNYFAEFDLSATGRITYWEYYLRSTTPLGQALDKLLI